MQSRSILSREGVGEEEGIWLDRETMCDLIRREMYPTLIVKTHIDKEVLDGEGRLGGHLDL